MGKKLQTPTKWDFAGIIFMSFGAGMFSLMPFIGRLMGSQNTSLEYLTFGTMCLFSLFIAIMISIDIYKSLIDLKRSVDISQNSDNNKGGLQENKAWPATPCPGENNIDCGRQCDEDYNENQNNPEHSVHKHAPYCDSGVSSDREHSIAEGAPKKEVRND
ncbi:MAG: hypothetical protein GX660_05715 [Clostridiaceae bacterium]|nr:hypothetical protein [Clostridiaceae bacterium]